MNPKDRKQHGEEPEFETDNGREAEEDSSGEPALSKEESLEKELQLNKESYEALNDQYLRLAADFDNYRKRVSKEKADLISFGNEELIKSLLSVLDNLERALGHSETKVETKPIVEGIKLIHKQFVDCLEKAGVKTITVSKGDEFDPNLHQAVERAESDEVDRGCIISEFLKGYTLKDRLIRPALVSVSKGEAETSSDLDSGENEIEVSISNNGGDGKTKLVN